MVDDDYVLWRFARNDEVEALRYTNPCRSVGLDEVAAVSDLVSQQIGQIRPPRLRRKKPGPPVHDDLCAQVDEHGRVRHAFGAEAPNELWLADIERHEALCDRAVVKGHRGPPVAAGGSKLGAA